MKTMLEKGSIMIASPLYHQKGSNKKGPHSLLRYVTQRSLAVVMFIAFTFLASIGNKSSITPSLSGKQTSDEGAISIAKSSVSLRQHRAVRQGRVQRSRAGSVCERPGGHGFPGRNYSDQLR